jgi:hypothetical protein
MARPRPLSSHSGGRGVLDTVGDSSPTVRSTESIAVATVMVNGPCVCTMALVASSPATRHASATVLTSPLAARQEATNRRASATSASSPDQDWVRDEPVVTVPTLIGWQVGGWVG